MQRDEKNYIALGCAIAYVISFLALPFFRISFYNVSGWSLIQINVVFCLPLLLGVAIILGSVLFDVRISLWIGIGTMLILVILILVGRNLLLEGTALASLASSILREVLGNGYPSMIPLMLGFGAILTLLFCFGFIIAEIYMFTRRPVHVTPPDDWGF
jgi:hypothetical protein